MSIVEQMLAAAKAAAGPRWNDIRQGLREEFASAGAGAEAIALEVKHGSKTKEQARIELQSITDSMEDAALAMKVALKAAAQAAVNAALDVLRGAVNRSAGIAIF